MSSPNRGRPDSIRTISAASSVTGGDPGFGEQALERLTLLGANDQVDPHVSCDAENFRAVPVAVTLSVLRPESLEAHELDGARTDHREQRPALADVLDLDLAADAVHPQVLEDGFPAARIEVEPGSVAPIEVEDTHVRLQVPLAIEQRRVAALTRGEGLDVVGELAL